MSKPTAEPPESLRDTIRNCKDILDRRSYKGAAVIFLISQIGSDATATTFLRSLETDPQISSMVFCSTENLAAKFAQFQSSLQDKQYTAWVSNKSFFVVLPVSNYNRQRKFSEDFSKGRGG